MSWFSHINIKKTIISFDRGPQVGRGGVRLQK